MVAARRDGALKPAPRVEGKRAAVPAPLRSLKALRPKALAVSYARLRPFEPFDQTWGTSTAFRRFQSALRGEASVGNGGDQPHRSESDC